MTETKTVLGRVFTPIKCQMCEVHEREARMLLLRLVKYAREDKAVTPGFTRFTRLVDQVDDYLKRTNALADAVKSVTPAEPMHRVHDRAAQKSGMVREEAWKPTALDLVYLLSHPMLTSSISELGIYDFARKRSNRLTVLGFAVDDCAAYITELDLDINNRTQPTKYWATRDQCLQALLGDTFE